MCVFCTTCYGILAYLTIFSKLVIRCDKTFPVIQIRNETTRNKKIYSSNFKRVYVNSDHWNPDSQCSFNPRFVEFNVYIRQERNV